MSMWRVSNSLICKEPYHGMIRDYSLKMLNNEELLRDGGILLVLDDLRNLPPEDRLKAYNILIKKGSGHQVVVRRERFRISGLIADWRLRIAPARLALLAWRVGRLRI